MTPLLSEMTTMMLGAAFAVAVTFLAYLPFYRSPLYQDQSLHYYIGRVWLKGKIPYRDYGHGPGPHLALLYAVFSLLARDRDIVVIVLSVAYIAVGNVFLFLAAQTAFGYAAACAASALFAFYIFSPRLIGDRFTPEVYMTTPSIMSLYFLFLTFQGTSPVAAPFLCGLCLGAATLLRQGALFYLPPICLGLLLYTPLAAWVCFAVGFMVLHLFWMGYFWKAGALSQYLNFSIWYPINLILHAHPEGKGKVIKDEMRRTGTAAFELIRTNSLTILPLFVAASAYLIYSLRVGPSPYAVSAGLLYIAALALILPRRNYDCCYWLNSVPFASLLAGVSVSLFYHDYSGRSFLSWLTVAAFAGYGLYVLAFDYTLYATFDPEKRDRLYDPQKIGHASWWPTFNIMGRYIKEHTNPEDKVLVLGHAARIYNTADRYSFFYLPSFVPFKSFDTEEYTRLFESLKKDYPEMIVLAGHMPAYLFNQEPYHKDLESISLASGIVYAEETVIDGFPIYRADREKSCFRALVRGKFDNVRLKDEWCHASPGMQAFGTDFSAGDKKGAVIRYLAACGTAGRNTDIIFAIRTLVDQKTFVSDPSFLHDLLLILGETFHTEGKMDEAETTFQGLLAVFTRSAQALNNLGAMRFAAGKKAEARVFFQRALDADPRNEDARANLAALDE